MQYCTRRKSIRQVLREFTTKEEKAFGIPLKHMTEEEAITTILKWISDKLPEGESVLIRIRDSNGDAFEVQMRNQKRSIYGNNIRQIKKTKLLYKWKKDVTYDNLTLEKLRQSMKLADNRQRLRAK